MTFKLFGFPTFRRQVFFMNSITFFLVYFSGDDS